MTKKFTKTSKILNNQIKEFRYTNKKNSLLFRNFELLEIEQVKGLNIWIVYVLVLKRPQLLNVILKMTININQKILIEKKSHHHFLVNF